MTQAIRDEPVSSRRVFRSIGAVLIGIAVGILVTIATDLVLHAARVYPPWGQPMADALFVLATAYRLVYGVAGSYIAAQLAPGRPMLHALVAGAFGFIACIVGAVATWNRGSAFGPHWYPLILIATAMPCAWLGGKLRAMHLRRCAAI